MARQGKGKSNAVKRAIITPDKHFPYHDKPAIAVLCKAIEMVQPEIYVDLGDIGEWENFSKHKWRGKKRPPLEFQIPDLETDIVEVNKGMDIVDESLDKIGCKEKYITVGNHDNWLNTFVEEHPYCSQYRFHQAVKLNSRGYTHIPFGEHLKLGKLYLYHGHQYGGQYHTANHLRKLGCNIMYGHWHDLQHMTATHMDGPKAAWSIGCLKDMAGEKNKWLANRKINWAHAFALVEFYEKGMFTVNVVQIIDGKCSLWGQILNGNK
tara:strand:- start:2943 stop:3737 length:795 start_codon:yes stop_codon:yes gene_type:complete